MKDRRGCPCWVPGNRHHQAGWSAEEASGTALRPGAVSGAQAAKWALPLQGVPEEVGVGGINVPCAWVQLQMPLGAGEPYGRTRPGSGPEFRRRHNSLVDQKLMCSTYT